MNDIVKRHVHVSKRQWLVFFIPVFILLGLLPMFALQAPCLLVALVMFPVHLVGVLFEEPSLLGDMFLGLFGLLGWGVLVALAAAAVSWALAALFACFRMVTTKAINTELNKGS